MTAIRGFGLGINTDPWKAAGNTGWVLGLEALFHIKPPQICARLYLRSQTDQGVTLESHQCQRDHETTRSKMIEKTEYTQFFLPSFPPPPTPKPQN